MSFLNRILSCSSGCAKVDAINLEELEGRKAVYLDVRTSGEYATGHIEKSHNIPLQELGQYIEDIRDFNAPVIAYCRSGKRSEVACTMLKAQGIECYNGGGFIDLRNMLSEYKTSILN